MRLERFQIKCSRERQRVDEPSARWRSQLRSRSRPQFNLNRSKSLPEDIPQAGGEARDFYPTRAFGLRILRSGATRLAGGAGQLPDPGRRVFARHPAAGRIPDAADHDREMTVNGTAVWRAPMRDRQAKLTFALPRQAVSLLVPEGH